MHGKQKSKSDQDVPALENQVLAAAFDARANDARIVVNLMLGLCCRYAIVYYSRGCRVGRLKVDEVWEMEERLMARKKRRPR